MKNKTDIKILDWISKLATEIRNDWEDPRWKCRAIWEAVDILKDEPDRYEHLVAKEASIDEYLLAIDKALKNYEE